MPEEIRTRITIEEFNELNCLMRNDHLSFMMKFYEYNPDFINKINELASTTLTYSEIEICACTKLGFSTKDIAFYRKCSIRSVENRKYRIRKKMMLTPETDFISWIASISY